MRTGDYLPDSTEREWQSLVTLISQLRIECENLGLDVYSDAVTVDASTIGGATYQLERDLREALADRDLYRAALDLGMDWPVPANVLVHPDPYFDGEPKGRVQ